MKKYLRCILLTTLLIMIASCKNTDTTQPEKDRPLEELLTSIQSCDTSLPKLTQISSQDKQPELNFRYLSDADYTMIHSYLYAYSMEGTAEEIAVIKLNDKNDAAAGMDSLHKHIEDRKGTFQEYAPEQVALMEKAVVTRNGRYIALIICSKSGLAQKAFQSCFE